MSEWKELGVIALGAEATRKPVVIPAEIVENCSFCGERNPRAPDACPHCGRMPLVMVKCVQCKGSGRVDGDVCLRCEGKGKRVVSGSEGGSR
jgi:hypothetical protein